jgi:hypothetical protein
LIRLQRSTLLSYPYARWTTNFHMQPLSLNTVSTPHTVSPHAAIDLFGPILALLPACDMAMPVRTQIVHMGIGKSPTARCHLHALRRQAALWFACTDWDHCPTEKQTLAPKGLLYRGPQRLCRDELGRTCTFYERERQPAHTPRLAGKYLAPNLYCKTLRWYCLWLWVWGWGGCGGFTTIRLVSTHYATKARRFCCALQSTQRKCASCLPASVAAGPTSEIYIHSVYSRNISSWIDYLKKGL